MTGAAQSDKPPPWYFNGVDAHGPLLVLDGEYDDSFDIGCDAEAERLAKCINAALSYWCLHNEDDADLSDLGP